MSLSMGTWPRLSRYLCAWLGHDMLKRHSIKRNLRGAGNHQVIEATQGVEKIERSSPEPLEWEH